MTKDFAGVALPLAVAGLVMELPQIILGGVRGFVQGFMTASGGLDPQQAPLLGLVLMPVSFAVGVVSQAFFLGGIMRFALSVARGRKPEFAEVFAGGKSFAAMLVGQFLLSLGLFLGCLACVVPGIIFSIGCQFYALLIVDRELSGVDALKASWQLTQGHKSNLAMLGFLQFCVALLGAAACCVGVFLVAAPIGTLALAYVYLKLNNEEPAPVG